MTQDKAIRSGFVFAGAILLFVLTLAIFPKDASAIPPGGVRPDAEGANCVIASNQLKPGDYISFTLTGYPPGQMLNIKIDDGAGYSDQTVSGSGSVYQGTIGEDGSHSGSFRLPGDISEGVHWLRFLSSAPQYSSSGEYLGVKGYSFGAGSADNTGHPSIFHISGPPDPDAPSIVDISTTVIRDESVAVGDGSVVDLGAVMSSEEAAAAADDALFNSEDEGSAGSAQGQVDVDGNAGASGSEDGSDNTESGGGFPIVGVIILVLAVVAVGIGAYFVLRKKKKPKA